MNVQGMKVVVVGGAIGGASAAIALARSGARVTLLEREPAARPVGAGIALAANGLAVLASLGVDVSAESSVLSGVRVVDARGRTLFEPRNAQVRMIRRSRLYALLAEAVAHADIDARYGHEFSSLSELDADLVVGADGVHSRVRAAAGFAARVRKSGIAYARGLAPPGLAQNEEAWTSAGLFGSFAVPDGTYWYASLGTVKEPRHDLDAVRDAWAKAYPASKPILHAASVETMLINDVLHVDVQSYVRGNVALLGDAAHAMAPNVGQGANAALLDAWVLSEELRRNASLESALRAYDQRRRPRVAKVAQAAARLGKLAELTHPLLRSLRDRVVMPIARSVDNTRLLLQEDPAQLARASTTLETTASCS